MAVDEFLRDERLALDLTHRVGLRDIAVNQAARDVRFVAETPQEVWIAPPLLQDPFDYTQGFQTGRARHGQENLAHSALAERAQQDIRPEACRKFLHRSQG